MQTDDLTRSLPSLFSELVFGSPETGAFMLNPKDPGLLDSLDRITAEQASTIIGRSSIAAHVRHLEYGLSLMNRWAAGENPFTDARWSDSWKQPKVSPEEWDTLRRTFRETCGKWHTNLSANRTITGMELDGVLSSIAHLAYHMGALRQMAPHTQGPLATD